MLQLSKIFKLYRKKFWICTHNIFLLKVYQHYSETLLKQAMNKIKSDQMVTVKKHHLATIKKYGNYMPMSSSQYQLSINYIYKFQTKWTYDVFKETYDVFIKLLQWYSEHKNTVPSQEQQTEFNGVEIPFSSGIVTVMHDLLARDQIDFDIEMPDQIIMLDARHQGKDETYFRVAERYQDILTRLYRFKFENVEAQNAEVSGLETKETSHDTREDSLKRKRSVVNNDSEESMSKKISRKDEESNGRKQENQFQQNEDTSCDKKLDESDKHEETNSKDRSEQSKKKTHANRSSRKRSANIEEDSTDCEESFLKRTRLNSEDSMDFEDLEEDEESKKILEEDLCEDFGSIEKILSDSSKPINELNEQKEEGILYFYVNKIFISIIKCK